MKSSAPRLLFLSAALALAITAPAANVLPSNDAKKLAARYALTKTRIEQLLGARLHPEAMPATALPNPFYRPGAALEALREPKPESLPQSEGPDLTDSDTLVKHATTLKLGGYLVQDDVPHVTINGAICKAGDTITVGPKDRPVFLHIVSVNAQEVTLRLNEVTYTLPMKK